MAESERTINVDFGGDIGVITVPASLQTKSREEKKAYFVKNKLLTQQQLIDIGLSDASLPVGDVEVFDTVEQIGDWTLDNMDVVAPAAVGVAASMMTKGAATPIAASAIASAASKYYADTRKGEEPSIGASALAGAESIGIDLVTLGAAKVGLPMLRMMGFASDEATDLIEHAGKVEALPPGTQESLRQTQSILRQSGQEAASLSAAQTGNVNRFLGIFENVMDNAPITGGRAVERANANNAAVQSAFLDLVRDGRTIAPGNNSYGVFVNNAVKAGKSALSNNYIRSLDSFSQSFGDRQVKPDLLLKKLQQLQSEIQISAIVAKKRKVGTPRTQAESALTAEEIAVREKPVPFVQSVSQTFDPQAAEMLSKQIDIFSNDVITMPIDSLIKLEKSLRQGISGKGKFDGSAAPNPVLDANLATMADAVQEALELTLRRANPKAAEDYASLKTAYKEGLADLVPPVNMGDIKQAGSGYFEAAGRTLLEGGSKSQVDAYLNTIRRSYAELRRAGGNVKGLTYKNADEAIEAMRRGYVENLMPNVNNPNFDINDYKRLATEAEKPSVKEIQQSIMGEDYDRFKALLNAMSDAGSNDGSLFGALLLNSKTTSTISGLATMGAGAATGGPLGAAAAGLGWLVAPGVVQRIVSSPKAVNQLLMLQNKSKSENLTPEFLMSAGGKIFNSLSDEDKAYIQNRVREEVLGPTKAILKAEDVLGSRYGQEGVVRYRPAIGM
jgi:hypothetical protein